MKSMKKVRTVVLFLLFTAFLIISVNRAAYVLREKEGTHVWDQFQQLAPDSVDVIFIGTSHQFCTIDPDLLYEEYGINGFMLATSAQTVPMSYYAAMEAISSQHPKAIVMEMAYCANDFRTVTPEMSHLFFDGMPWREAKRLAVKDLIPQEEQIYYYLNLGQYHARWKELAQVDFKSNLTSKRGGYVTEGTFYNWEIPVIPQQEKTPMPEEMLKYLDMLVTLCAENEVELILYTAPFNSLYNEEGMRNDLFHRQRIFNWIGDYAEEKGLRYYNLFYELEELNLDGAADYKDSQHFNTNGQAKVTRYMAERGYFDLEE